MNSHYLKTEGRERVKRRVIQASEFTLQSISFIAEPNRLGAEADELVHQRLSKNKIQNIFRRQSRKEKNSGHKIRTRQGASK
jgi:hypothetical protein